MDRVSSTGEIATARATAIQVNRNSLGLAPKYEKGDVQS
jgi:hypothetical protein